MKQLKLEHTVSLLDFLVGVALFGLGCYFLNQGDVWQKYQAKRTNFAVSTEIISELPTITAGIHPWDVPGRFGEDFNVSFGVPGSDYYVNLTYGNNFVPSTGLRLNFQRLTGRWTKIEPLNFKPGMDIVYKLKFTLKDSILMSKANVLIGCI